MATFAKIGLNGKVIELQTIADSVLHDSNGVEQEVIGIDFLTKLTGYPLWVQTSYNTIGGVHKKGGVPLRKNYASIGGIYDEDKDAFIAKNSNNGWILNEKTCLWEPPVAYPTDGQDYVWNNVELTWTLKSDFK